MEEHDPKLTDKIKEVLIEARMVLPGAQALLGFQFIIVMMKDFDEIPLSSKYVHFASLSAIALATVFLITPAAYHRIVYGGEDSAAFHRSAGRMVLVSMFFLGLGTSGDFFVVCRKLTGSDVLSATVSLAMLVFFYVLWFGWTSYQHRRMQQAR